MQRFGPGIALVALLVGLVGLVLNFVVFAGEMTAASPLSRWVDTLLYYWTFFTHLSNLGLVLVYLADLTGWRGLGWFGSPVGKASMAGNITLVMVFYHFLLAPNYHFTGLLLVANVMLHYVAPILYLAYWLLFTAHGRLRLPDVLWMLVPGLLYVAWVLARGAFVHRYPYDILDVGKAGYLGVAEGVGVIIVSVAVFCAVLVLLDRLIGRRLG